MAFALMPIQVADWIWKKIELLKWSYRLLVRVVEDADLHDGLESGAHDARPRSVPDVLDFGNRKVARDGVFLDVVHDQLVGLLGLRSHELKRFVDAPVFLLGS